METAVVSSVLRTLALKIFAFLQQNRELHRELELDIQYIRNELVMIAAAIEDHGRRSWSDRGTNDAEKLWIEAVRDLAYSIEDCMDRFLHRVTLEPGASLFRREAHRLKTAWIRTEFAAEIRKLRKKSEETLDLREKYTGGSQSGNSEASAPTLASDTHTPAADLVGVEAPVDELLELMGEDESQRKQLKVVSVVGFGGLGKSVLARQVYNSATVGEQYDPRIWVRASDKGAVEVLKEILQQVQVGAQVHDGNCDDVLRECLRSKRFFIVIDDMRTEYWNTIKNAFPKNVAVSSRVLVTTAIQSVANACSADNGHVYVMRTLNEEHSRQLFFKEASLDDHARAEYAPVDQVVKKCDGLPLALVTTAQFLQSKGQLTPTGCADLCRYMGEHIDKEETLSRMKNVLFQNYYSLPGHVLKACLLYFGIFPSGRPVRRKCLIRRWLAEGFVEADHRRGALVVALDNFKELMNRSIIQPVDMSNNIDAKTCQTHGMMLEFILQKSMCENFITLLYDQAHMPEKVRRLSLHHDSAARTKKKSGIDLSLVRSLTVFGKADQHVLKFSKYELLRVLDLEEYEDLTDKHVKNICNLLLLRYLSLGGGITVLPQEIKKLRFLETLDARRAKKKIVSISIEVIKLPCLIHLLGMFSLQNDHKGMTKLQSFLSDHSNLETLAGFVADQSPAFPQLMNHMNSLTKVKVLCEPTGDGNDNFAHLASPIKEFIQRGTNVNDARSLSLSFKGCSQDFLDFTLEQNCFYLSSLKLHGELGRLPQFVTMLGGVTELCLSCPDQLSEDVLAALSRIRTLHYLKMIARQLGRFVVEQGALRSLRRLYIVVQSLTSLENEEGALVQLESLCLLCKDLNGLCGARIELLGRLKEVTLDDGLSEETKLEWKEAAKKHMKRPRVSFHKTKEVYPNQVQMGAGGEHRELSGQSPAVQIPDAADIQRQVPTGSEAPTFHKKFTEMFNGFCSPRKRTFTELHTAGANQPSTSKVFDPEHMKFNGAPSNKSMKRLHGTLTTK